eukprot:12078641-Heterocapsa_arctica.AAC.1
MRSDWSWSLAPSDMASRTPPRGEVPANTSGLGPVLNSFTSRRDLMLGSAAEPLLSSATPALMGSSPVSAQHIESGTLVYTS